MRNDGRTLADLRKVKIQGHVNSYAEGSCLIQMGNTHVLCTASIEKTVPKWLQGQGKGWVSAEYGMLPRSTHTRMKREQILNGGRTQEISRLIGRSLRSIVDLTLLNENSIYVDCDVIQADGGTRTAAVTGGFVALALAIEKLAKNGAISKNPLKDYVSAVSVGLSEKGAMLDLNYEEDSSIDTDMNFVITGQGHFVEVQGTAEKNPFSSKQLSEMSDFAFQGCKKLNQIQSEVIGHYFKMGSSI
jgi:ribonuclease PH